MTIEVHVRGVENPTWLRNLAEEKFAAALQRFESHVQRAVIRVEDETGPNQSRIDKVCAVELKLARGDVRVREIGKEFESVIDIAIDRMRAALSRQVSRDKQGIGGG